MLAWISNPWLLTNGFLSASNSPSHKRKCLNISLFNAQNLPPVHKHWSINQFSTVAGVGNRVRTIKFCWSIAIQRLIWIWCPSFNQSPFTYSTFYSPSDSLRWGQSENHFSPLCLTNSQKTVANDSSVQALAKLAIWDFQCKSPNRFILKIKMQTQDKIPPHPSAPTPPQCKRN